MTPFEYSLVLVTIIVGLAMTDMLVSLHRLLRSRTKVHWHWLPLISALLVLLVAAIAVGRSRRYSAANI